MLQNTQLFDTLTINNIKTIAFLFLKIFGIYIYIFFMYGSG